jgi:Nuclease-related domain
MTRTTRRPGQNIRELAQKRRKRAIASFGSSAGIIVCLPIAAITESVVAKIYANLKPPIDPPIAFPLAFYITFAAVALILALNGLSLWKKANRATQGAKGEEATGKQLIELKKEGWDIEYGMPLGSGLGDADIVCVSPQGKAFVIDVKSHRGQVVTDGKVLYRRTRRNKYPFEKNFLGQSMKQAFQVKQQKGLNFVTPIVAFSDARVSVPSGKVAGVHVVGGKRLVGLLRGLG